MANGKWQMANGKWQMANGKWQMANGKRQTANGKGQLELVHGIWDFALWASGDQTLLSRDLCLQFLGKFITVIG